MLNQPPGHRQSLTLPRSHRCGWLFALATAAVAVVGASAWFVSGESAAPVRSVPPPPPAMQPEPAPEYQAPVPKKAEAVGAQMANVQPASLPPRPEPAPVTASLEQRFLNSRDTATRIDLAGEIAGANDDEAVLSIARLFHFEHHHNVKVALLAGLADIDPDAALETRFAVLTAGLRSGARDVRLTSLEVLARLDTPRAILLLGRAKIHDPDKEVRETAAALLQAAAP